ncbi:E3 ubiquitin-protein ligase TM129 [Anopheles marshallii]|uniref:E3 ubiquitin-protein ligase TM129 n=1 Tax=Anopheles marshallii TaxID=1521116 RepID=UPI00237B66E8|nr:E3 ubiquitin-protein ligase TM129 [Anopheles marshallii]
MVPHIIYIIVFVMLYFFTIFPTSEMESVGLTVNQLCTRYLAAETDFVLYHMKATSVKLLIHSTLPIGYVIFIWVMAWLNPHEMVMQQTASYFADTAWNTFCSGTGTLLLTALITVFYWAQDGWSNHPIAKQLQLMTTPDLPDWRSIATNINDEYRRDTKIIIRSNAISTLVVTESWIIKTNMYVHNIVSQSEAHLFAYKIDTKEVITDTLESAEFVNILVKPLVTQVKPFTIRMNIRHINELGDRLQRPIVVMPSVQFRSLTERFVDAFKEEVALNPTVASTHLPEDGDCCLACLQVLPDVKIVKYCVDEDAHGAILAESERCQPCGCRPLWCVGCLATWFASQQRRAERDTWMSKKTTCPMCRARFCVRDVCYLENRVPVQQTEE